MSRPVRVCTLAQLDAAGGLLPVAHGGREAVVVRAGTGEVFAVARACPHEGYPLEQGEVVGETITCPWHGWRFDLRSGACLTPGEDTQTFPVAIREDEVLVDLDVEFGPGERALRADALASALESGDEERAARNSARLLAAGATPIDIAQLLARFAASHGAGLGLAGGAVADALALAEREPAQTGLLLAQAASIVAALDGRGAPRFPAEPGSRFAEERAGGVEAGDRRQRRRAGSGRRRGCGGRSSRARPRPARRRGAARGSGERALPGRSTPRSRGARGTARRARSGRRATRPARGRARRRRDGAGRRRRPLRRARARGRAEPTSSRAISAGPWRRSSSSTRRARRATRRCSASRQRWHSCTQPAGARARAPSRMRAGSRRTHAAGGGTARARIHWLRPISWRAPPMRGSRRQGPRSSSLRRTRPSSSASPRRSWASRASSTHHAASASSRARSAMRTGGRRSATPDVDGRGPVLDVEPEARIGGDTAFGRPAARDERDARHVRERGVARRLSGQPGDPQPLVGDARTRRAGSRPRPVRLRGRPARRASSRRSRGCRAHRAPHGRRGGGNRPCSAGRGRYRRPRAARIRRARAERRDRAADRATGARQPRAARRAARPRRRRATSARRARPDRRARPAPTAGDGHARSATRRARDRRASRYRDPTRTRTAPTGRCPAGRPRRRGRRRSTTACARAPASHRARRAMRRARRRRRAAHGAHGRAAGTRPRRRDPSAPPRAGSTRGRAAAGRAR